MKKAVRRTFKILWISFLVYVAIGTGFYFLQDYILFHPQSVYSQQYYTLEQPHAELTIPVNETDTLNIADFKVTAPHFRGIVIYFHGNRKNISWYARYMPEFTNNGYEVLMLDYPGFGKSKGSMREEKLYYWALQVYKLAIGKVSADSIIIYGKSMGTGIAAQLASIRDCKRLILETPYYDLPSVIRHYMPIYPVKWMLHYQLPTWQYLEQVSAPITLLHGTSDGVVTYKNSLRLKQFLKKSDELFTVKGGSHNNLFQYPAVIRKLDSILALPYQ
jgi:alpha-beta hydrolase superfamily lysophospholipase